MGSKRIDEIDGGSMPSAEKLGADVLGVGLERAATLVEPEDERSTGIIGNDYRALGGGRGCDVDSAVLHLEDAPAPHGIASKTAAIPAMVRPIDDSWRGMSKLGR